MPDRIVTLAWIGRRYCSQQTHSDYDSSIISMTSSQEKHEEAVDPLIWLAWCSPPAIPFCVVKRSRRPLNLRRMYFSHTFRSVAGGGDLKICWVGHQNPINNMAFRSLPDFNPKGAKTQLLTPRSEEAVSRSGFVIADLFFRYASSSRPHWHQQCFSPSPRLS